VTVTFRVIGKPQPAGSKKGFVNPKTNKVVIVDDAKNSRPWKQQIAGEAAARMTGRAMMVGPVEVELHFTVGRPKSHYTPRGTLRKGAPSWPIARPDVDKMSRACLDSMTAGGVYRDDAQVVRKTVTKSYGAPEGVLVIVRPLLQAVTSQVERSAA
jgi:Holliday junction resolvase RusA-like endonuclease